MVDPNSEFTTNQVMFIVPVNTTVDNSSFLVVQYRVCAGIKVYDANETCRSSPFGIWYIAAPTAVSEASVSRMYGTSLLGNANINVVVISGFNCWNACSHLSVHSKGALGFVSVYNGYIVSAYPKLIPCGNSQNLWIYSLGELCWARASQVYVERDHV